MNYVITRLEGPPASETVDQEQLFDACERISEGKRYKLDVQPQAELAPKLEDVAIANVSTRLANSTFEQGGQVTDDAAKKRIEGQRAVFAKHGVKVDENEQLYATGVRMADIGYQNQDKRAKEHAARALVVDAAHEFTGIVKAEGREDIKITAASFGQGVKANGRITFDGLVLGEHAIRGLATRLESPMLSYLLGLSERIAKRASERKLAESRGLAAMVARLNDESHADRAEIAAVIAHECKANPDVVLKLRTRRNVGDIYATVSPTYAPADAPQYLDDLIRGLPRDARGSFSYDAASTQWKFDAYVWTPTPVEEQAVGEAFEGYVTYSSRDNGTSRFRGGGGITLIRCLNASTYVAEGTDVSRVHRGNIRSDIRSMTRGALSAIHALCEAWGVNRETVIEAPSGVKINDAIPGFWRHILQDRKSELAGVLPGRTEENVKGLTAAYFQERRDQSRIVRSDFAQAWTRYIQDEPATVRREGEASIGDWLVRNRAIGCDLRV